MALGAFTVHETARVKADAVKAANAEAQYTFGKLIEAWVAAREGDPPR